jgi:hypothetical protein
VVYRGAILVLENGLRPGAPRLRCACRGIAAPGSGLISLPEFGTVWSLIGAFACLAAALVFVGEGETSQTDDLALTLSWQAPTGCPDQASERAEIRRRLAGADRPAAEPIVANGEIRRDPTVGYVLSLRTVVGDTTGERVLSGQDCQQLAQAAALILAMLINPEAAQQAPPSAPPAPAAPPSPPPPPPSPPPRSGLGVGLDALLATGVLPGLAEGLALRVFYGRGIIMASAQVAGFLPKKKDAPVWPGATASFYRLDSALEICATKTTSRGLGGTLCVGGSLARLHGRSAGVTDPGQAAGTWIEAVIEPSVHLHLTPGLRLRLAGDVRGFGARPDLAIAGLGSVYRPPAFNYRLALGIDFLF